MLKVVNFVSLWDLGKKVRLAKVIKDFKADLIQKKKNTLLLFESGKIIATGFTSLNETKKFIAKTMPTAKLIKVCNITAVGYLRGQINLKELSYEPELFPAYNYKIGKIAVIYFPSKKKLIVTGGKTHQELRDAYNKFKKITYIKDRKTCVCCQS